MSRMPPELGGKWETECLDIHNRIPLPTLLCAGYSVKLIKKDKTEMYLLTVSATGCVFDPHSIKLNI